MISYLFSFGIKDKISNNAPFVGLGGLLGDVEDGGTKGMALKTFRFEIFDE
jgi:hypothetical protein